MRATLCVSVFHAMQKSELFFFYMPPKRSTDTSWRNNIPVTQITKATFINECASFIASEPTINLKQDVYSCDDSWIQRPIANDQMTPQKCFTYAETKYIANKACIVCESRDDVRVVLGNPFTMRCYVSVCKTCVQI